ncbi:MAG: DHH family phosphoesterase, partial [candidate division WOR-3 bacterium]|nr:DHH family phosphoesterase [candidate division WOR-3 bacterium]
MWKVKEVNKSALAKFIRATGLKESLARLLFLRDVKTQESAQKFLNPQLSDLHSPSLLPDIEKALERIIYALKNRESILIWGHEDLDGITSTVILYETLRDLRASDIQYYIPEKHVEKHGLNSAKVKAVNQIKLVITVDCGITNFSDVQELKDSGIDTVIIEHHEVLDKLPDALANIDPKRKDSKYPFRGLAAAGVTLKIVMALSEKLLKIKPDEFFSIKPDLLALTALGTISDRVPLLEENRILVKYGLEQIKKTSIPAIRVLLEQENLDSFDLTADKLLGHLLPLFASANGNQGCQYFLNDNYEANR